MHDAAICAKQSSDVALGGKDCHVRFSSFFDIPNSRIPQAPKPQRADPNAMSAAPAPGPSARARKGEFVDNRIGAGVAPSSNNENRPANAPSANRGFGDSGAPAIKVHHAPGGKSNFVLG